MTNTVWKRCPICGNANIKFSPHSMTTTAAFFPVTDKDGNAHFHDGNTTTTPAKCGNRHTLIAITYKACWCGWRKADNLLRQPIT